jgi:N-acetylmuramoyl-L-alanine amidase
MSFAVASHAAPCTIEGRSYDCQPNITSEWIYSATAAGGFPSPFTPTSGAAVSFTLAAFTAYFTPSVSSLSPGSLGPFSIGSRGTRQYATMPISIVWYPGTAPETAYLSVVGHRDAFTCPVGYTAYWPGDQGIYWAGTYDGPLCYAQRPPKVIAIDPGHGFNCPANGMAVGAVGITDFPPNDPPAGRLREDDLTMVIAREVQRILPTSKYRVVLTKRNANECPSFVERGRIANEAEASVFVSVHINAPLTVSGVAVPAAHGTSVLYNVRKSGSFNLAESMARAVSSSLGVNNRGVMVDDELAVLKPTVTEMNAVLLEAARLSGTDEIKLHASGSTTRIATGIKAALDESLGN